YVKTSGSGCTVSSKPTITKVKLSKESLDQFMTFLLDKNNATPSSYKVNEAINAAKGLQGTFIANLNPSETPNPF
ncbi:13531_t:CDS:2, partial [Entrophospora sp. SA101]